MTIRRAVCRRATCDRCETMYDWVFDSGESHAEVRALLAEDGWVSYRGQDLCGECAPLVRREGLRVVS